MIEVCKDLAIFGLVVLFFTLLTGASLWLVVFERDALVPEYRKFFESVLTVLMSGSVSFFLGKHVGRSGKG